MDGEEVTEAVGVGTVELLEADDGSTAGKECWKLGLAVAAVDITPSCD